MINLRRAIKRRRRCELHSLHGVELAHIQVDDSDGANALSFWGSFCDGFLLISVIRTVVKCPTPEPRRKGATTYIRRNVTSATLQSDPTRQQTLLVF